MNIIKNELGHNIFYEVDDLQTFNETDLTNFTEIPYKHVCFVNEEYDISVVKLDNDECFYEHNNVKDVLLLVSNGRFYEVNWNGEFLNVLQTSADEYDILMLDKIRNSGAVYFTTQF